MLRHVVICAFAVSSVRAFAQGPAADVQIDQARQFSRPPSTMDFGPEPAADFGAPDAEVTPDDAFGAQVIFKRQERVKPFTAFAEAAAFFTNNVALAKRGLLEDKFLVIAAGGSCTRPLGHDLRLEAGVRAALYRYAEYRELDFQSVDLNAGVAWSPPVLHGAEVSLRYLFNHLSTAEEQDEIYKSHAALLGIQKVVPFSRAHAAYFGATAQWTWAEPQEPGRDEYVAFAGYHLQAAEHLGADLGYRYGYFVYRQAGGRRDQNHSISLSLRYSPVEWAAISASSFLGFNRSNRSAFDYDVLNAGVGLQFSVRF
jgi:hypothetical protein